MAYVTQADVEHAAGGAAKLIELADHDKDGVIDAAVYTKAVNDAERWIDSFLEGRFADQVPLAEPVPDVIRRVCAQEVVYVLRDGRQAVDQRTQDRHLANEEWLNGVSQGRIGIGLARKAKSTVTAAEVGDRSDVDGALTRSSTEGFW